VKILHGPELFARAARSYRYHTPSGRSFPVTTLIHTAAILATLYAAVLLMRFSGL